MATRACPSNSSKRKASTPASTSAAVVGSDDRLLPEHGAQACDVVLESIARRGRQLLTPQGFDELVHARDAAAAEREQRKQCMPLAATDLRRTPSGDDLERPEKPDLE
jgi:hypothetical protein